MENINFLQKKNYILGGALCLWAVLQILFNTIIPLDAIRLRGFHTGALIAFAFLIKGGENNSTPKKIFNLFLFALSIFTTTYFLTNYSLVVNKGGFTSTMDLVVAGISIVLVLIAGYRVSKNLFYLIICFIAYLYLGKFLPYPLGHNGFSISRILNHMYWGSQGIFGVGTGVSATYIFLFVLFGSTLKYSGFSDLINNLALSFTGSSPGGPAKVAVIASAFMGMINGSAVANVATTGSITIPMMKENGYDSDFAAAVEAAASTGGQFCPPIMGAVGFLMAEFLAIPYRTVMFAMIIPAGLYYLSIYICVHLQAKKENLKGIDSDKVPDFFIQLKERGVLLIPICVFLYLLIKGYTPIYCATAAMILCTVLGFFVKDGMSLKNLYLSITEGASSAITVGISCVLIGIIIGTVSLTSLGLNMGYLIVDSGLSTNLFVTGILVMIMSTILGMGVPGVAAYVILVSVTIPILVRVGAGEMAAHIFCLIYACLSNITPPVAISAFVASAIANSNPTKTAIQAIKLAFPGFIIPFFLLYNEALMVGIAPASETILATISASIGVSSISMGFVGYYKKNISTFKRVLLILSGMLLIHPGVYTDIVGIVPFIIILLENRR